MELGIDDGLKLGELVGCDVGWIDGLIEG